MEVRGAMGNRQMKLKKYFLRFLLLLFAAIYIYFSSFAYQHSYLGISADYVNHSWVVSNIHNGGEASSSGLAVGDKILEIDHKSSQDNPLLNKLLIVEQATSMTVLHQGIQRQIVFQKTHGSKKIFLMFSLLSIILFALSYGYSRRHEISRTSQRYYIFTFLTSLLLVSIIPSSMGNVVARLILVIYITLFPFFIDMFWRAGTLQQESVKFSKFSKLIITYSAATLCLLLYSKWFSVPLVITIYLVRGIFYVSFTFLVALFLITLVKDIKNNAFPRLNIVLLVILCLLPLFIGYVFPLPYDIPFMYTIPLLLLPILAIINNLIINRLTTFRFHLPVPILYVFIAMLGTVMIICLYLISDFMPKWLMISYSFLLTLCSIPIVKDLIFLNIRTGYQLSNKSIFLAVEAEREDISIYLHDTIIQDIIYYKKRLENMDAVSKKAASDILDDVIFELRELCSNIYPLMIQELGLKNAILDIISKFQKKESVIINDNIQVEQLDFGQPINNFILRSIRELINNSILHGNAKEIDIHIYNAEQYVVIKIVDGGHFKTARQTEAPHFGLTVIAEKLALLGGQLLVDKHPTTIVMLIPRKQVNYDKNSNH
ncbi:TPA: histidine kinase [Streptococcus equi subsp. equi]|uniref:histidine kinase n=2 Tax=Streptococcus equi TaxID=1336 RepID=C0MB28_STRE4|nr:histidine kinase [Streptococcus equi subsp. equi]NBK44109.1 histidine kinase [Streptococcus equi]CAW95566.1 putative sensor kinase [Streptococcus equi subsp. equi 4047]MBT1197041.1 histidine kinase [Streptococcus equi subsp. equi]MBT1200057.1 histidine kinase [Streptococcus equi subsp. equi]